MKKLLVDAGNSSIKWALLDSQLPSSAALSNMKSRPYEKLTPIESFKAIVEEQQHKNAIDEVIIVSVLGDHYSAAVKKHTQNIKLALTSIKSSLQLAGITSAYTEPHKLGTDRLVAMIAAFHEKPDQACIVVDSGTATTIDTVDADGKHLGGVILPGLELCSSSLLENTEMLASFNENKHNFEPDVLSTNTKQAIASGSFFGLVGAIDHICQIMEREVLQNSNDNIVISKIICGGSADKLLPYLPKGFKHHDDLIMQGLRIISDQNKKQN